MLPAVEDLGHLPGALLLLARRGGVTMGIVPASRRRKRCPAGGSPDRGVTAQGGSASARTRRETVMLHIKRRFGKGATIAAPRPR
jgi:hypothetical protein